MARIALVEPYPYEAAWGGDAVYLDGIRTFLTSRGHHVDTYITDLCRGRSNPAVKLHTAAASGHRWFVRNAVRIGDGQYCSLDPRMIGKAMRRLPRGRAPHEYDLAEAEARWVLHRIEIDRPDLVILAFGACAFAPVLRDAGVRILALKGFFSDRRIRLRETMPTPFVAPALLSALASTDRVGFNNRFDLDFYRGLSGGGSNGALVGMGFPARFQPEPDGTPVALFVAARTKPNVESLDWFLTQVWPRVMARVARAKLRIAGSIAGAVPTDLPGVTALGFVDDLAQEYRRARIVVAPLVSGSSGVKTKVAEALSFGRPVVTTSLGGEPGEAEPYGRATGIADAPQLFADEIVRLFADDEHWRERYDAVPAQFHQHFSYDAAYREISFMLEAAEVQAAAR